MFIISWNPPVFEFVTNHLVEILMNSWKMNFQVQGTHIRSCVCLIVCRSSSRASSVSWLFWMRDKFCSSSSAKISSSCWGSPKYKSGSWEIEKKGKGKEHLKITWSARSESRQQRAKKITPKIYSRYRFLPRQSHKLRQDFLQHRSFDWNNDKTELLPCILSTVHNSEWFQNNKHYTFQFVCTCSRLVRYSFFLPKGSLRLLI